MPTCFVKGCNSRTENVMLRAKKITLFRFPKEVVIRQQWLAACKRNEANIKIDSGKFTYICEHCHTQIYNVILVLFIDMHVSFKLYVYNHLFNLYILYLARVCNLHFEENCFEKMWTKPRTKNSAKEICRLKKNAVPSKLLNITKETGTTKVKAT